MKTIEQVIGENITEQRKLLGWTQQQLGDRLEAATGREWPRQSVWAAERGKRAWAITELVSVAAVFGMRLGDLVASREDVLIGAETYPPKMLRSYIEGNSRIEGGWSRYETTARLAYLLRVAEREYREAILDLRNEVNSNPDLAREIRDRVDLMGRVMDERGPDPHDADGHRLAYLRAGIDALAEIDRQDQREKK